MNDILRVVCTKEYWLAIILVSLKLGKSLIWRQIRDTYGGVSKDKVLRKALHVTEVSTRPNGIRSQFVNGKKKDLLEEVLRELF